MNNLPPGVTEGMIPGNRPEDVREEAFWNELINRVENSAIADSIPPEWYELDWLTEVVGVAKEMAYTEGLNDGRADEAMAQLHREEEARGSH